METTSGGFVAIPKFILQNSSLTSDAIVLYANLLHFDRGGSRGCFAKRETLSRFSNLSLHKIRNAIKVLEDNGVISVVRRRNSLTDVIKITPDCRAQIKEAKSRKPAHRQPVSKPCTPQEVKEFNLSSLKANKTKQENKACPTANSERVKKPQPNRVESTQEEPLESIPNPIHQRATDELLGTIQGHIQPRSYEVWLKDIWVENETDTEVTLKTPKGFYVANYIKDNYLSKIESITGKQVRVLE